MGVVCILTFTLSPFHPFTLSPFHPFTLSPFHLKLLPHQFAAGRVLHLVWPSRLKAKSDCRAGCGRWAGRRALAHSDTPSIPPTLLESCSLAQRAAHNRSSRQKRSRAHPRTFPLV